jgi:IS605 OrfB family transposase
LIQRLEKQKKKLLKPPKTPGFKGNILNIHANYIRFLDEEHLRIAKLKEPVLKFFGADVKKPKGKDFFQKAIKNLLSTRSVSRTQAYALIKRTKTKREYIFVFNYPVTQKVEIPEPTKQYKVMGIDRGINHIAVTAIINNPDSKPFGICFYKNPSLHSKLKFARIRHIIQKKTLREKERWERSSVFGQKVKNLAKLARHEISKQIVKQAHENRPIVIVLEDIKRIKQRVLLKKKGLEKENFKASNADYVDLQRMIQYKANLLGIPVKYIRPEYTSQVCYRHNTPGRRNKQTFYCEKYNHQLNADLNAAINVAKRFFEIPS